jgi:hypothetical protein
MNKKVFFGLLVTVTMLATATAGCTSSTNSSSGGSSQSIAGYATYTNATAGVSMQYPSGWKVTEGENGSIATFSTVDGVVNVKLLSYNVSTVKESLDEFKNATVSGAIRSLVPGLNWTLVSTENTTLAGMPAYNLTLTRTSNGVAIKQIATMTEKNYQVYDIVSSTTSALWPDYQNDFSNMTNSFAITS